MRVLHIVPSLTSSSGGPAQVVTQLCQELKKQGIEVTIATTKVEKMQVISSLVPAYYFQRQFSLLLPLQFAFSMGLKKWLHRHIRKFDLVHIHYLFTYPSTIAAHYANKYKIPYIVRPVGMLSPLCLKKSAFKKKLYTLFFEKRNLKNAAAIHFTSEEEMNVARNLKLNNQCVLVPNGLNLEKFKNLEFLKGIFRKQYPQINGKKIILFLSRIHPIKGLDLLIPALKILSQKRSDFVFVLVGSGPKNYERRVKRALASASLTELTIFTGFLEDEMKFALLADADVFVLPSYHESFGMAVAEAMAAGLPVIISNKVNIYKLIEDYQAGIVTELDVLDIALALERLLEDEHLRLRMGANGRRLVEDNFDVKKTAKQMLKIYNQIVL
jgi:glycosyltransferase involved in cell wall biosynthesis